MLEEILNFISQKYFYIPASVIGALVVIVPSFIKMLKIFSSNTFLKAQLKQTNEKMEMMHNDLKTLAQSHIDYLDKEKERLLNYNSTSFNSKQKVLNNKQVEAINIELEKCKKIDVSVPVVETPKENKKVRVRVKL